MSDTSNYEKLLEQLEEDNKLRDSLEKEKIQRIKKIQQLSREMRECLNMIESISDHVEPGNLDNENLCWAFFEQAKNSHEKAQELLNLVTLNSSKKFGGALSHRKMAELLGVSHATVGNMIRSADVAGKD